MPDRSTSNLHLLRRARMTPFQFQVALGKTVLNGFGSIHLNIYHRQWDCKTRLFDPLADSSRVLVYHHQHFGSSENNLKTFQFILWFFSQLLLMSSFIYYHCQFDRYKSIRAQLFILHCQKSDVNATLVHYLCLQTMSILINLDGVSWHKYFTVTGQARSPDGSRRLHLADRQGQKPNLRILS